MNDQTDQQQQTPQDPQAAQAAKDEAERKEAMNKAKGVAVDRAVSRLRYRLPYPLRMVYDILEPFISIFTKKK